MAGRIAYSNASLQEALEDAQVGYLYALAEYAQHKMHKERAKNWLEKLVREKMHREEEGTL